MKIKLSIPLIISASFINASGALVNPGFEDALTLPGVLPGAPGQGWWDESLVPGWDSTAVDNAIELWGSGFFGVSAANGSIAGVTDGGTYFAELNANYPSALYQDSTIATVGVVSYTVLHRGRAGLDTMTIKITDLGVDNIFGTGDDAVMVNRSVSTDNVQSTGEYNGWAHYFDDDAFTSIAGRTYRFSFEAVSTGGDGNIAIGNFIDNANFGVGVAVPEPSSLAVTSLGLLALFGRRRRC